ncbi:hypothetical protein ABIE87_002170 [Bradyrhizobium diazoefficiens]
MIEIALGVVELGLGLRVGWEFLQRQVGIAEQLRLGRRDLLLDVLRDRA